MKINFKIMSILTLFTTNLIAFEEVKYHPNRNVKNISNYKADAKKGIEQTFYKNGNIKEITTWNNDKKSFIYHYFYKNGKIMVIKHYDKNKMIKKLKYFDTEDKIRMEVYFNDKGETKYGFQYHNLKKSKLNKKILKEFNFEVNYNK